MRLFKMSYKARDGRRRKAAKWSLEFRDPCGKVRRLTLPWSDKPTARRVKDNIVRLVGCRRAGVGLPEDLERWLATVPPRLRDKLAKIGLLEPRHVAAQKTLAEHLADFRGDVARGKRPKSGRRNGGPVTDRYCRLVCGRVERVFAGCGFKTWTDAAADGSDNAVLDYLAGRMADVTDDKGNVKRGISAQTANFYLEAVKSFGAWMVREGRAAVSPFGHLEGWNTRTDRRHDRRALTVAEAGALLAAAAKGPERYGMTGGARATLYRLAVESGLRAGELRSLTPASFDLAAEPPTVTVEAAYSKHRREDVLPLRPDTAAKLKAHLARKAPAAPAFALPKPDYMVKMLRADLAAAGIAYRDDAGRVADFHSLRHTFVTNLARSGVHPKTAQALARHSTISLTMDTYTHSLLEGHAAAVGRLPDLDAGAGAAALAATGTDDARPDGRASKHRDEASLCAARRFGQTSVDNDGQQTPVSVQSGAMHTRRGGRVAECGGLLNR